MSAEHRGLRDRVIGRHVCRSRGRDIRAEISAEIWAKCRPIVSFECPSSVDRISVDRHYRVSVGMSVDYRPRYYPVSIGDTIGRVSAKCRPKCRSSISRDIGRVSADSVGRLSTDINECRGRGRSSISL